MDQPEKSVKTRGARPPPRQAFAGADCRLPNCPLCPLPLPPPRAPVLGQRLADLENKGRAMVGMAGRLSDLLPASFVADLSRLEANIVN